MTPVTEKQVLRYARVPRAPLRMTTCCLFLKKKQKREASALVILSAVGAKDLLFREHP
jgi:hypothetical protein